MGRPPQGNIQAAAAAAAAVAAAAATATATATATETAHLNPNENDQMFPMNTTSQLSGESLPPHAQLQSSAQQTQTAVGLHQRQPVSQLVQVRAPWELVLTSLIPVLSERAWERDYRGVAGSK